MWLKSLSRNVLFFIVAALLLFGCRLLDTAESPPNPSDSTEPTGESDTPPPAPDYEGPAPAPGTGNVYGRILWNGQGAAGLDISMCQDFNSFVGCGGEEYVVKTAEDGAYLFSNLPPGTYALSVRVFDSDDWLYVTSGILSSADFIVEADETLVIDAKSIFKLDLKATSPQNQGKVKAGELTLTWEAYPDAAYYQIYLTPAEGDAIFVNERMDGTEITAELYPVNCDYRWSLEAFNSDGVKIAETAEDYEFRVAGQQSSCRLQINAPVDGEELSGTGIVLDWEPHSLAASYKILMWNDTDPDKPNVLDFVTVSESRFAFNGELEPARYVWSVSAYDEVGKKIAGSQIFDFTVRP